jgi:hypothetical protein
VWGSGKECEGETERERAREREREREREMGRTGIRKEKEKRVRIGDYVWKAETWTTSEHRIRKKKRRKREKSTFFQQPVNEIGAEKDIAIGLHQVGAVADDVLAVPVKPPEAKQWESVCACVRWKGKSKRAREKERGPNSKSERRAEGETDIQRQTAGEAHTNL